MHSIKITASSRKKESQKIISHDREEKAIGIKGPVYRELLFRYSKKGYRELLLRYSKSKDKKRYLIYPVVEFHILR